MFTVFLYTQFKFGLNVSLFINLQFNVEMNHYMFLASGLSYDNWPSSYNILDINILISHMSRQVTKLSRFTPIRRLLAHCNWLSIKQLIFYHSSALTVFRSVSTNQPLYLSQHLVTVRPYPTRLATGGGVRVVGHQGGLASNIFLIRAANTIPADIRLTSSLPAFKQQLKKWTKEHIPIFFFFFTISKPLIRR